MPWGGDGDVMSKYMQGMGSRWVRQGIHRMHQCKDWAKPQQLLHLCAGVWPKDGVGFDKLGEIATFQHT